MEESKLTKKQKERFKRFDKYKEQGLTFSEIFKEELKYESENNEEENRNEKDS